MSRKQRLDFEVIVSLVDGFLHEFQAETDRGTTVVAAAYLDDLLATMLRKHLIDNAEVVEGLSGFQGPLGSFSSRIDMVYCLGLTREDQFRDLNTVRKIRNEFAHSHQSISFEEPPVCDLWDNLGQIKLMMHLRDQMSPLERDILIDRYKTRRQMIVGNTVHLVVGLMVRGQGLKHRQIGQEAVSEDKALPFEESGG